MTVSFELDGQPFLALNGGPDFTFNEAIPLLVDCEDQSEVDYFWDTLGEGGEPGPCGWIKDKYGLSWQIVPTVLIADPNAEKGQAAMKTMLSMGKLDVGKLKRAHAAA